ncbi:MAG: DUF2203 domain-containing protein [Ignavibacteria bacterium]|nr:DUF2203 domain-containing protein [Ignavibacteria bacterium]
MQHTRHYTLIEAKETLFLIQEKLERLVELKKNLDETGYDIFNHSYFGGFGPNGTGKFPEAMEELVLIVKYFSELGIIIKDINKGLIDFPHIRSNGEEVYLCYLLGESTINYWHTIPEGFSGRESTDKL